MPNPPTDSRTGRGDFGKPRPNVSTVPDLILPFLSTGGWASFTTREDLAPPFVIYNPAPLGAQLITSVFVPPGRVGWLKQIRVGPRKPAVLHDVWDAGGIRGPYPGTLPNDDVVSDVAWQNYAGGGDSTSQTIWSGIWEDPFGWETYRDPASPFSADPAAEWHWQLTLMPGNIDDLRRSQNIPQFNFLDPASWYLAPNIPVPLGANGFNAYPGGIPGNPVGVQFGPQRAQATPKDPLNAHLYIPENTTLCLFATWRQISIPLTYLGITPTDPVGIFTGLQAETVQVLGPSYGSLLGYTQPLASQNAVDNAVRGWGG